MVQYRTDQDRIFEIAELRSACEELGDERYNVALYPTGDAVVIDAHTDLPVQIVADRVWPCC